MQTSSRPLTHEENQARLALIMADHRLFKARSNTCSPERMKISTYTSSLNIFCQGKRLTRCTHSLTFTSPPPLPTSHMAAGSAVWSASVALYICIRCWFVHYLQFLLSTAVPSCVCTTCQLKWKYVAWWHTAHVRNGLEEWRNPQTPGERRT